jgi:hypothetical protein
MQKLFVFLMLLGQIMAADAVMSNDSQIEGVELASADELVFELMNYHLGFGENFIKNELYFLPSDTEQAKVEEVLADQSVYQTNGKFPELGGSIRIVGDLDSNEQAISYLPLRFCIQLNEDRCDDLLVWDTDTLSYTDVLSIRNLIPETVSGVAFEFLMKPELVKELKASLTTDPVDYKIMARVDIIDPASPTGYRAPIEMTSISLVNLPETLTTISSSVSRSGSYLNKRWNRGYNRKFGSSEINIDPTFNIDVNTNGGEDGFAASAKARARLKFTLLGFHFDLVDARIEGALIPAESSEPDEGLEWGVLEFFSGSESKDVESGDDPVNQYNEALKDYQRSVDEKLKDSNLTDAEKKDLEAKKAKVETYRQNAKNVANRMGWDLKEDDDGDDKADANDPANDKSKSVASEKTTMKTKAKTAFKSMAKKVVDLDFESGLDGDKVALDAYLKFIGVTVWSWAREFEMKIEGAKGFRKEKGISKTIMVGWVPVSLRAGVSGELGLAWVLRGYHGFHALQAKTGPFIDFGFFASAGVNLAIVEAGIKGTLTIIRDEVWADFNIKIHNYKHLAELGFSGIWGGYSYTNASGENVDVPKMFNGALYNVLIGPKGSVGPFVKWWYIDCEWHKSCKKCCWVRWCWWWPSCSSGWREKYWPIASFSTFKRTDYFARF